MCVYYYESIICRVYANPAESSPAYKIGTLASVIAANVNVSHAASAASGCSAAAEERIKLYKELDMIKKGSPP